MVSNIEPSRKLEGKVALITGANSGIGLACVERFVAEGAIVVASDIAIGDVDELRSDQVVAIEKEAFSPLWVSTSFKRDINNKRANYLVACFDDESSTEEILAEIDSDNSSTDDITPEPKLWKRVLGLLVISMVIIKILMKMIVITALLWLLIHYLKTIGQVGICLAHHLLLIWKQ